MEWVSQLFFHPLHYIGILMSFAAALSILWWGAWFFSKAYHVLTFDANSEHLAHAREGMWNGILLLLCVFIAWEVLRWIGGIFSSIIP